MTQSAIFNFPVDTARMMRAVETPDDIGAVVRIHFEIDRALEHIVNVMVPAAKHLGHRFMDQRIKFLLSLGLPEERVQPARVLNIIRNDFAHREKEALGQSDVDSLEGPVVKMLGQSIPADFALRHNKEDGSQRGWMYGKMSYKEKFCMLGFFTLSGIATIENHFSKIALVALSDSSG